MRGAMFQPIASMGGLPIWIPILAMSLLVSYILMRKSIGMKIGKISFMLIAAGLLSRVAFDYLVKLELSLNPKFVLTQAMTSLQSLMLFFSIFLLTSGYVLLLVLFYKIQSKRIRPC